MNTNAAFHRELTTATTQYQASGGSGDRKHPLPSLLVCDEPQAIRHLGARPLIPDFNTRSPHCFVFATSKGYGFVVLVSSSQIRGA